VFYSPPREVVELLVSRMDCKNLVVGKAVYSGDVYQGSASLQKGGHAGSRRRAVIGLDLRLGPAQRKCGRASYLVVQQG
jgi:hypothetical protein